MLAPQKINFGKSRAATIGSYDIVLDNDTLGEITAYGADGGDMANAGASIVFEVDGTPGVNDIPGRILFNTATGGVLTERVQIDSGGLVGVGISSSLAGQIHVDQASASGAIPVLTLDQGDIDDTFINLIGTSAMDGTRSISSDTTEDSDKFGAIRVEINGVTKWIRIYDDES